MFRTRTAVTAALALGCLGFTGADAAAQGILVGKIEFKGDMKAPKRVRVSGDAFCVQAHASNPLMEESFVFNTEEGTLCNVIVYVSSISDGSAFNPPAEPVVIDQVGCQYTPHVNTVTVGQKVQIKNSDSTAHNLNLKPAINSGFNVAQAVAGMVHEVTFEKVEHEPPMPLKCDVHSWMNSYIAVFDHPFHAVSDEKGAYRIEGLPAGEYEVSVWHEFKFFAPVVETQKVTVVDGQETTLDFAYDVKK